MQYGKNGTFIFGKVLLYNDISDNTPILPLMSKIRNTFLTIFNKNYWALSEIFQIYDYIYL